MVDTKHLHQYEIGQCPIKELLVNRYYDRTYDDNLEEKYELKRSVFKKINQHKFTRRSGYFEDAVRFLNDLKSHDLFAGDYFPYKVLLDFYAENRKYVEGIGVIREFLDSDISVSEAILSFFEFYSIFFSHETRFN